jgi:hypothetical protein
VDGAKERLGGTCCVAVTRFRSMLSLYRVPIRGLLSTQSQEEAQRAASKNLDRCVDETVQPAVRVQPAAKEWECDATPRWSGLLDCILAGALMALLRPAALRRELPGRADCQNPWRRPSAPCLWGARAWAPDSPLFSSIDHLKMGSQGGWAYKETAW